MESTANNFKILSHKLPELYEHLEKLNKKCAKLGCIPITITIIGTSKVKHHIDAIHRVSAPDCDCPTYEYTKFKLSSIDEIKLAGYTFLGTLDHYSLPGTVLVHTVPGKAVPPQYFHSAATCDHCNKIRSRTETFVVQHDDGSTKQVGRQCLADFLGIDPTHKIKYLSIIRDFIDDLSDDEYTSFSGGSGAYYFPVQKIIEYTIAIVRKHGYISKANAEQYQKCSTASRVIDLLLPPNSLHDRDGYEQWCRDMAEFKATAEDLESVASMLQWVKEQPDTTEYMHNLITIANVSEIPMKLIGYAASIVPAYNKAMGLIKPRDAKPMLNEHLGNVGDKLSATVTIKSVTGCDSYYGQSTIINMVTQAGHRLTWFASGCVTDYEKDKEYTIKFTVKDHSEYQGMKQTKVVRVKAI